MTKIGMIGCGKLGLMVGLSFEDKGHEVMGYDINPNIAGYLEKREIPFRETQSKRLLEKTNMKMLSLEELVAWADILFAAPQTPHDAIYEGTTRLPDTRADFDYTYLEKCVSDVSEIAKKRDKVTNLVVISTCLPGTYHRLIKPIIKDNNKLAYVYNPMFIAMGNVYEDVIDPEFNLIGVEDEKAARQLAIFYKTINDAPHVKTDIITAEGIKVSYNTWITAKTVIANVWGELAEKTGMDFSQIFRAWSLSNKRLLTTKYMRAGMGDGGGCHPRDNIALSHIAKKLNLSHNIFEDLMLARESTESWHADEAMAYAQGHELPLILLGKAFKPETDIEVGSPAILMANILKERTFPFTHLNDLDQPIKAVYFITTQNERYKDYKFPLGSVVIEPFGYIKDRDGVEVIRLGRR